jgi:DNA-binding transcriptional LysR family regulator
VTAVDAGSIAAAASVQNIAPSAASRRISDMEHAAGTVLLYRKRTGVEPTPAGQMLAHHARNLIRLMERMEGELSEFAGGIRGQVRIVANTSVITEFLPEHLSSFLKDHPDVRIALNEVTSDQAVSDVMDGHADIALFSETVDARSLEVFPYATDQLTVIAPSEHPLSKFKELQYEQVLPHAQVGLNSDSSLFGHLTSAADELGHSINFAVQVASFDAVMRMVEAGLGVGILPDGVVSNKTEGANIVAIPLIDNWAHRQLLLGVREERALTVAAKRLLQYLLSGSS